MEIENRPAITVEVRVHASLQKAWNYWTEPSHIVHWYHAGVDWHSPSARNDLKAGGTFNFRMEAKDGSSGFDFEGVYTSVTPMQRIDYELADGRKIKIKFEHDADITVVTETFDAENENPPEMQRLGWQMILDNFKRYTETH